MKRNEGFTVFEALISLWIIGVLMSIILFSLFGRKTTPTVQDKGMAIDTEIDYRDVFIGPMYTCVASTTLIGKGTYCVFNKK